MQPNQKDRNSSRSTLTVHRRVGLISFACLVLGLGYVSSVVVPGLQKNNDKQEASLAGTNTGWFKLLSVFGVQAPKSTPQPSPLVNDQDSQTAQESVELAFSNAPVGNSLQLLLMSGRFNASVDPLVTGNLNYSCLGHPQAFWKVIGRLVGAAPAPGVHVVQTWDAYRILPRDMNPMMPNNTPQRPVIAPSPVPLGEGKVCHRMAGYINIKLKTEKDSFSSALLETRIPGEPPQWHLVRVGDLLRRKSPEAVARTTNPADNIDSAPIISEIEKDHLTIQGGGNKSLRVPFGNEKVADIFGFGPDSVPPSTDDGYTPSMNGRSGGMPLTKELTNEN